MPLSLGRDDTRNPRLCPPWPLPGLGVPRVQEGSRRAQLWHLCCACGGLAARSSEGETEIPRRLLASQWSTGYISRSVSQCFPKRRNPPVPPTSTSGSGGENRKWAGGSGCARRRWRRCRAAASRPRAGAGSERSRVEVRSGA